MWACVPFGWYGVPLIYPLCRYVQWVPAGVCGGDRPGSFTSSPGATSIWSVSYSAVPEHPSPIPFSGVPSDQGPLSTSIAIETVPRGRTFAGRNPAWLWSECVCLNRPWELPVFAPVPVGADLTGTPTNQAHRDGYP